jgi:hypothetical protein
MANLKLEVNETYVSDAQKEGFITQGIMMTPAIGDDDYWIYRVRLSKTQSIIAFPKFGVVGIGFAKEDDWNTNLPSSCTAEKIYNHIKKNKGDSKITKAKCIEAIKMIQAVANIMLEAVKQNGNALKFIKKPSKKMMLEAVKVQLEAVKQNGWTLKYIKKPSKKIMLEAVK